MPYPYQPDRVDKAVANVARSLIEAFLDEKIVILMRIAIARADWASPFFWTALDAAGGYHIIAMRYNNDTSRWFVESGVDQEWTFEHE